MESTNKTVSADIRTKAVDGVRTVTAVVTSGSIDRDGEFVDVASLRLPLKGGGNVKAAYLTGSEPLDIPFLLNHSFDVEDMIGAWQSGTYQDGELTLIAGVSTRDKAQDLMKLFDEGFVGNNFSITMSDYIYDNTSKTIYDAEVVEVSFVFKGSNKDARLVAVKSILKGESMAEAKTLEQKKAELETLQKEIEADEAKANDAEKQLRDGSDKIIKSYQEKTKGLVADIVNADHSWQTEDLKWEEMQPINELFWALQEAWFLSTTKLEDFDALVSEFASLIVGILSRSKDLTMSDELSKALDGKTLDDIAKIVESEFAKKEADEAQVEEAAPVEETQEAAPVVAEVAAESKSIKEKQMDASKQVQAPVVEQEVVEGEVVEKAFDKVELTTKQWVAFLNKDEKALAELNKMALDTYKSKETYHNAAVVADGGALVPSNELLQDVFVAVGKYSSIASDLRVVTLTAGDGIDYASLVTDVVMTEVAAEGDPKDVTKMAFAKGSIDLREFAGIAIITKKLVRQAAVSVYDVLVESFARAIANKRAQLALTDATSGAYAVAGSVTLETAADVPTWQEIRTMPFKAPTWAVNGGKYYISRALLEQLVTSTLDANNNDMNVVTLSGDGLSGTFANGFPFSVEEELGTGTGATAKHAIFVAAGRYGILLRQGVIESETFDSGIVTDGSAVDHNLLQENKLAQRVAFYENVGWTVPGAIVKTVNAA